MHCLPWTIQYKCHFYHLHLTNFLQHFEGWCTWFKCVFHGWEWTFEYKLHLLPFFILCLLGRHGIVGDQMLNIQLHRPQPSYDSIRVEIIPVSMTVIGQIQSIKALIGLCRLLHPQISGPLRTITLYSWSEYFLKTLKLYGIIYATNATSFLTLRHLVPHR